MNYIAFAVLGPNQINLFSFAEFLRSKNQFQSFWHFSKVFKDLYQKLLLPSFLKVPESFYDNGDVYVDLAPRLLCMYLYIF